MSDISAELKDEIESQLGREFDWNELEEGLNTIYSLGSESGDYILKVLENPENRVEWFRAEPNLYSKISEETDIPSPEIITASVDNEENCSMLWRKGDSRKS